MTTRIEKIKKRRQQCQTTDVSYYQKCVFKILAE